MDLKKTAFITFFPIKPDNMGSSAVINSRYKSWPQKKKIFQLSHINRFKSRDIENKKGKFIWLRIFLNLKKISDFL